MKKSFLLLLLVFLFIVNSNTNAQVLSPQPSPKSTITQRVGLTDFTVTYSRPSMKGRVIFGDLVPFEELWRTGANESTKIKFTEDITIGSQSLKAGEYAIYTIPGKEVWEVIFYKNTSFWGNPDPWKEEDVAVRVKSVPLFETCKSQTFTIEFSNITNNSTELLLRWDYLSVPVKIMVDTDSKVLKSIETALAGPSANDYYNAGRYYLESGKDANKAYEWLHKANEMSPKFYMLRQEALALAKLGRYKDAAAVAARSTELAKEAKNEEYVKMNTKDIETWANMK